MYDLETPALLLHLDVVERNVEHMAARARQLGVALRPHAKTHKCVELGRRHLEPFRSRHRTANKAEAARVAEQELSVMVGFAGRLREAGLPVRAVSVGSTPAMAAAQHLAGVTEARPGNYVFYDRTMVLIGCCEPADVGVTVLATVVSHQPGAAHFIVNAGALELSKDPGP